MEAIPKGPKVTTMTGRDASSVARFLYENRIPLPAHSSAADYLGFCRFLASQAHHGAILTTAADDGSEITGCIIILIRARAAWVKLLLRRPACAFRIARERLFSTKRKQGGRPDSSRTSIPPSPATKADRGVIREKWAGFQKTGATTLYVFSTPEHRKARVGTTLLRAAEAFLQSRGEHSWCCRISRSNEASLRLHARHGFQILDDGSSAYLAVKLL